jgi:hypothetical protein
LRQILRNKRIIVLDNTVSRQIESATANPHDDLVQSWQAALKASVPNASDHSPKLNVLTDEGDGGPDSRPNPNFAPPPSQQEHQPPAVAPVPQDFGPQRAALTNGTSGDQNSEVQSLRAPLDAAQTLSDNWVFERMKRMPHTGGARHVCLRGPSTAGSIGGCGVIRCFLNDLHRGINVRDWNEYHRDLVVAQSLNAVCDQHLGLRHETRNPTGGRFPVSIVQREH